MKQGCTTPTSIKKKSWGWPVLFAKQFGAERTVLPTGRGSAPNSFALRSIFLGGAPTSAPTQELAQKPQCPIFDFFFTVPLAHINSSRLTIGEDGETGIPDINVVCDRKSGS
jgi:hypothetical protein